MKCIISVHMADLFAWGLQAEEADLQWLAAPEEPSEFGAAHLAAKKQSVFKSAMAAGKPVCLL